MSQPRPSRENGTWKRFIPSISLGRSNSRKSKAPEVTKTSRTVTNDPVSSEVYFCGLLPRPDVDMLLVDEGEFMVRKMAISIVSSNISELCVSVRWEGKVHHLVPRRTTNGMYVFTTHEFTTFKLLIDHHYKSKEELSTKTGIKLLKPYAGGDWFLRDDQLDPFALLGQGNFGQVWCASLKKKQPRGKVKKIPVAVKFQLETGVPQEERNSFFSECRKLRQLQHRHLVGFVGLVVDTEPIKLVMEYCDGGLLSHLKKFKPSWNKKTRMALHISRGMEYLAARHVIHRDLAGRNCLLKGDVVKISDLGMSKVGQFYTMKEGNFTIPIKWTCPTTMKTKRYGDYSDIWSFGILLWEISTDGGAPYAELQIKAGVNFLQELLKFVEGGGRLQPPHNTPEDILVLMKNCTNEDINARPRFTEIRTTLENIYTGLGGKISFIQSVSTEPCHDCE